MTTDTKPTQDALSQRSMMMSVVGAAMTMAMSAVTTVTIVVGLAAVASPRRMTRMVRHYISSSTIAVAILRLRTQIAIPIILLVARGVHRRLMTMHRWVGGG